MQQSPVVVADLWTGYDAVADNVDGVHPNDTGYQKMAAGWYPVLSRVLGGTTPPTTPPTTAPATPPTIPPAGACAATYRMISQWGDGFQGEATVRNDSAAPATAWTATVTFPETQQITQAWNAIATQNGSVVTARNHDWNARTAPGDSATFGFVASWTGSNRSPAVACTLH